MIILIMMPSSDERTEKATPKKRRDARKEGNVVKSQEVNTSVMLLALFGVLSLVKGMMGNNIVTVFLELFRGVERGTADLSLDYVYSFLAKMFISVIIVAAPLMITALIAGVLVNVVQTGLIFTRKALAPKLSRLNPLSGLRRMFSKHTLVNLIKAIGKVLIIGFGIYDVLKSNVRYVPSLMTFSLAESLTFVIDLSLSLAFRVSIYMIILAAADYFWQWWEYEKNLRMTKQEVKYEYKLLEGHPETKGRIRRKQREMAMRRMMQAVPTADVVVTNPTHYAVALKYDSSRHNAPIVIAKGKDYVALRIKEIAKEHRVEIVENKSLAQALYISTDIGEEIPEDLYKAVAEILAVVYRLRRRKLSGGTT